MVGALRLTEIRSDAQFMRTVRGFVVNLKWGLMSALTNTHPLIAKSLTFKMLSKKKRTPIDARLLMTT